MFLSNQYFLGYMHGPKHKRNIYDASDGSAPYHQALTSHEWVFFNKAWVRHPITRGIEVSSVLTNNLDTGRIF